MFVNGFFLKEHVSESYITEEYFISYYFNNIGEEYRDLHKISRFASSINNKTPN